MSTKASDFLKAIEKAHLGVAIASVVAGSPTTKSKAKLQERLNHVDEILKGVIIALQPHVAGKEFNFSGAFDDVKELPAPVQSIEKFRAAPRKRKAT